MRATATSSTRSTMTDLMTTVDTYLDKRLGAKTEAA